MEARLQELKDSSSNIARFIKNAKRYSEIPEVTSEILRIFIKRAEVGERAEKYSRTAPQEVIATTATSVWLTSCLRAWPKLWQMISRMKSHEQKREAVPKHSLPPQEQILTY